MSVGAVTPFSTLPPFPHLSRLSPKNTPKHNGNHGSLVDLSSVIEVRGAALISPLPEPTFPGHCCRAIVEAGRLFQDSPGLRLGKACARCFRYRPAPGKLNATVQSLPQAWSCRVRRPC